ncbi:two-component response regulator-like APRR5 [Cajanus cajan]|uniref:two-component response regulator-like APRR5 n=1 Tax=Cajanus cajan TaxID=3821 RepID=UPI00098D8C26|nr:two-component response regulator-like APRR5 [Cajanus cajan]XP_020212536.1 two-component response regulator-like APRR5 [Cajanus cajan]
MGEVMQTQGEQSNNASAVRWERFLPRMVLRVLLVEADDSTRQIIAALLRKCSYKVATVRDGLKAWETLKDKASDIDLILTEVDLPSISGFSLLTLIMEHDICKNIPVIMMSSHDSVSMVFKCMLKGASDFLIKPVRKNELRNLWQHVWRRHAISGPPQNLTLPQIELGVAAENDAASTDSSGSVASTPKNNECSEETSEAQDISQLKSSSNLSNIDTVNHENSTKCERDSDKYNDEAGEKSIFISEAARCNRTFKPTGLRVGRGYDFHEKKNQDEVLRIELSKANPQINTDIHECSDELVDPSTGAIDLIATFKNLPNRTDEKCSGNTAKFDFDTQLELSLRQDFPGSSCKAASEERQILNHSNVSAFSRYSSSKLLQPLFPTPSTISDKLTNASQNSHESHKLSENAYTSLQYGGKNQNQEKFITLVIGQSGQADPKLQNSQLGSFPATGVTSDHKSMENSNVFPSMLYAQSVVNHPIRTPKSVCQKESSPFPTSTSSQSNTLSHNSERHHWSDDATHVSDQNVNDQSNLDCETHDSSAAGQCADTSNHNSNGVYRSIGCKRDGNATSAKVVGDSHESFIDSGHRSYDGFLGTDSHRTSQREAALTKFRLKRKDRCYEKKVRYQSRKRLAEQRPRVKGQFVRQVHNDHPVADAGGGS